MADVQREQRRWGMARRVAVVIAMLAGVALGAGASGGFRQLQEATRQFPSRRLTVGGPQRMC